MTEKELNEIHQRARNATAGKWSWSESIGRKRYGYLSLCDLLGEEIIKITGGIDYFSGEIYMEI